MTTNTLYPGLPDYTGPTEGWFTLLHHTGPRVEYSRDVRERINYINTEKPAHERATRLRHIVLYTGEVPETVRRARAELGRANAEWKRACAKQLDAYIHQHVRDCRWNGIEIVFDAALRGQGKP